MLVWMIFNLYVCSIRRTIYKGFTMKGDEARFDEYQLVVLKALWLLADKDWKKYHPLRRELGRFLRNAGYDYQRTRKLLTQKCGTNRLDLFLATDLKKFINEKIQLQKDSPIQLIREVTELYHKREVLVA